MEDVQIIDLFFARSEDAIAAARDRYGGYCFRIAQRIVPTPEDAEECVSETWLRAWNAMPPQRPQILRLFLGKITRNVSLNRLAAETAAKRGGRAAGLTAAAALEELEEVVGTNAVEEAADAAELERCIAAFLAAQKPQSRKVFLRRYYFFDTTAEIARRCGLREANVLVILSRTRAALRTYLEKEGYAV